MRVSISTTEAQFTAKLKLPLSLILSAALTVTGAVAEAIRCELNIREVKAALAQCQKKPSAPSCEVAGQ